MAKRLTLLYRFSTDNGLTWVDFTEQVDSLQTSITDNLCTNNFTSAKDEAMFTMPETPLFDGQSNPTPKKLLMDALLGKNDVLVHINASNPITPVIEDDNDVTWSGNHEVWTGTERRFTGYADRSSIDLRSYPLPPSLTIKVQDVSTLHLDDKVDIHICWEGYTIKQIVRGLLLHAGYIPSDISLSDLDTSVMPATDNVLLEAFVVDKDNAKSYREYIDTLLFEAGGYVINFNEHGTPILVHLQWDGSKPAQRIVDNPMDSNGVSMRSSYLKEDGAKLTWSTLAWSEPGQRLWQSGISQSIENGELVGEKVQAGRYWPDGAEITPQFFEYDAKLLDSAYLTRESRKQNEDLTIIMAKDVYARPDSMRNGSVFTQWDYPIPTSPTDFTDEPYNLETNPTIWPTKAWWLLRNPTADDVNLTFFTIYGTVLYRKTRNTLQTKDSKHPKEYESTYIYDADQAERFLAFWWHFLQTSRYLFSWTDLNEYEGLNDIVAVGIKGNGSTQKALVVGKTSKWINNNHEIVSFNAVGIEEYVSQTFIPIVIAPSSSKPIVQNVGVAVSAIPLTVVSKTLAEWEALGTPGAFQTWPVQNASSFNVGDVALLQGVISDLDDAPISLFFNVTAVDVIAGTISGTGISIQYAGGGNWDFDLSQTNYITNLRYSNEYTSITANAKMGEINGIEISWQVKDARNTVIQTGTGNAVTFTIPFMNQYFSPISVTMSATNLPNVTKTIAEIQQTDYYHDFGAWEPQTIEGVIQELPTSYIDSEGVECDLLEGDFFVAKSTFTTTGGDEYTEGVPYEYSNGSWYNEMRATEENSERMLRALATVLNQGNIEPTTSALYAWFQNLTADIITAGKIFANDIESTNYQEDVQTGTPQRGYKLIYNGGEDSAGEIKSAGGLYANMNVRGALKLWTSNDEIAGADIQHPALSTVPAAGGDDVGTDPLPNPSKWNVSDFYGNSSITANSILSASSASYGAATVSEVVRLTNVNANASSAYSNSYNQGDTYANSVDRSYTIPSGVRGTSSVVISGGRGYRSHSTYYAILSSVTVYLNGVQKYYLPAEAQNVSNSYSTSAIPCKAGDSVRVVMSAGSQIFAHATINWNVAAVTFNQYGLSSVGLWAYYSSAWHNFGTDNLYSDALTFTVSGNTFSSVNKYSLVDNIVDYVSPYAGLLAFYGETNDLVPVTTQTYYTDNQGSNPTSGSNVSSYFPYQNSGLTVMYYEKYTIEGGRTYKLKEEQIYVGSTLKTLLTLSKSAGSALITFTDGTSLQLNIGDYKWLRKSDLSYGVSVKVDKTLAGVKMMGQYPKSDADLDGVGYDSGTPSLKWEHGYFKNLISDNPSMNSARKLKENIREFNEDALSIIEGTKIVTYNYKRDREKARKIGFIADDTPTELSGDNHDQFKMDHCIAVLIKAVQELNNKLDRITGKEGK